MGEKVLVSVAQRGEEDFHVVPLIECAILGRVAAAARRVVSQGGFFPAPVSARLRAQHFRDGEHCAGPDRDAAHPTRATRAGQANGVPVPAGEVFAVATEYVEAGRLDAAERMLGHILAVAPAQPEALHLKGLIAFRRGRTDDASVLMERSIAEGGIKSAHFRNLSEVYRLQAKLDQALAAARRAIALDPADPLGPFNLAMVHYDRMEVAPCIAAARHSLDLRATCRSRI